MYHAKNVHSVQSWQYVQYTYSQKPAEKWQVLRTASKRPGKAALCLHVKQGSCLHARAALVSNQPLPLFFIYQLHWMASAAGALAADVVALHWLPDLSLLPAAATTPFSEQLSIYITMAT